MSHIQGAALWPFTASTKLHTRQHTVALSLVTVMASMESLCYPIPVVPKRCVATPCCVGRDHEVCREIKKKFKLRLMMIINN
jgi:hypothetical protein